MSDRPTPETDALDCELHTPRVLQDRYSEMRDHAQKLERERDEALMDRARGETATMTINHYERILREREEWKNKAYSHATDYTLMEAKCFRLEQQLKEYDKLKS
jgi:hypothetical protein